MVDSIAPASVVRAPNSADIDERNHATTASLLDGLLGLQVAFDRCNAFAVDPSLSDAERAEFAALSTAAFGIVRSMVGPALCRFLRIVHAPETGEATRRETRSYLLGFLSADELDTLPEEEQCARLLTRLRARGFPVSDDAGR